MGRRSQDAKIAGGLYHVWFGILKRRQILSCKYCIGEDGGRWFLGDSLAKYTPLQFGPDKIDWAKSSIRNGRQQVRGSRWVVRVDLTKLLNNNQQIVKQIMMMNPKYARSPFWALAITYKEDTNGVCETEINRNIVDIISTVMLSSRMPRCLARNTKQFLTGAVLHSFCPVPTTKEWEMWMASYYEASSQSYGSAKRGMDFRLEALTFGSPFFNSPLNHILIFDSRAEISRLASQARQVYLGLVLNILSQVFQLLCLVFMVFRLYGLFTTPIFLIMVPELPNCSTFTSGQLFLTGVPWKVKTHNRSYMIYGDTAPFAAVAIGSRIVNALVARRAQYRTQGGLGSNSKPRHLDMPIPSALLIH